MQDGFAVTENRFRKRLFAGEYVPPFGLLLMLMVFTSARYMQWAVRREIFEMVRLEFVLGVGLSAICVALLLNQPINLRPARFVMITTGIYFVVVMLNVPMAGDPVRARHTFIEWFLKHAFLTLFMITLLRTPRYIWWFLGTYLFSCFYIYQESTQGLINGGLYWMNQGIWRLHGSVPIYSHPNALSSIALEALPFVAYLFIPVRKWYFRVALLAIVPVSLVCVVYSGSRTAYVAIIAMIAMMWLLSGKKLKLLLLFAAVLPLLLMAVPEQYKERFSSITGQEKQGHSKNARIQLVEDAWAIFLDNPLGVGVDSFETERIRRFGKNQDTHNLYLQVLTNLGVQGAAVFVVWVTSLYLAFFRAKRQFEAIRRKIVTIARSGAVTAADEKRRLRTIYNDSEIFVALSKALVVFLATRMVIGIFGHDLYFIFWWFATGFAAVLLMQADRFRYVLSGFDEADVHASSRTF